MARQEKRRHEVPVEKPLIRDQCARQEHNSNGCDGCLDYYSRPERFPAPVKNRKYILQSSPRLFCQTRAADNPTTEPCSSNHPHHCQPPVSRKNCTSTRTVSAHLFFSLCVAPRGTILALSNEKFANLTK